MAHPETAAKLAAMRAKVESLVLPDANPSGTNQYGCDNVTPSGQRGNSRDDTLRRLKRDRPDLAALVIGGELSANAAQERSTWAGKSL